MLLRCCCLCGGELTGTLREAGALFTRRTGTNLDLSCFADPIALYSRIGGRPGWDAAVVALPGALGMEAATRIREEQPGAPLIWCSDDRLVAIHSYRLHCAMFLLLPVTAEQLADALIRCAEELEKGGHSHES